MSTVLQHPEAVETPNYLNQEYGWKSWLFTKDHKRIAVLYIISITVMFFIGGIFASLIRVELLTPQGDLVKVVEERHYKLVPAASLDQRAITAYRE